MLGSHEIVSIDIDADALEPDNKEMIEDMIKMAINEILESIEDAKGDINERITGQRGGLGF
jgi:DNA-binding protein YbaB